MSLSQHSNAVHRVKNVGCVNYHMINLPNLMEGLRDETWIICFMFFFFLTFDVFRGSLQTLNFPLFTFYFHSLAEFFTRQADLQVLLLPLNPLSMHWFVSGVYLCIINEVGLRMTCSMPLQWGNVLRRCKASLCRNKKKLFSCAECFEAQMCDQSDISASSAAG